MGSGARATRAATTAALADAMAETGGDFYRMTPWRLVTKLVAKDPEFAKQVQDMRHRVAGMLAAKNL